jgi:hypothetical protein
VKYDKPVGNIKKPKKPGTALPGPTLKYDPFTGSYSGGMDSQFYVGTSENKLGTLYTFKGEKKNKNKIRDVKKTKTGYELNKELAGVGKKRRRKTFGEI